MRYKNTNNWKKSDKDDVKNDKDNQIRSSLLARGHVDMMDQLLSLIMKYQSRNQNKLKAL